MGHHSRFARLSSSSSSLESDSPGRSGREHRASSGSSRSQKGSGSLPPTPPSMGNGRWEDLKLELEFECSEDEGSYDLVAPVPPSIANGMGTFEACLSEDRSMVMVEGVSNPTEKQARHMQRKLAERLQRVAKSFPVSRLQQLSNRLADEAAEAYREMGNGRFGSFSESVSIPIDVDASAMKAYIEDGGLHIRLPKARTIECS